MQYRWLLCALLFWTSPGLTHGGGLDDRGGHTEKRTGEYHCHRSPCSTHQTGVQRATEEADSEGRAYSRLYNRREWPHWIDADRDCQDSRAEVLINTSLQPVKFKRNRGCQVTYGRWRDPFTNGMFSRAADLDIDHIVPLAWAHGHGGARWPRAKKRQFANDFNNLLAVKAGENRSKGAQGPDTWLPSNQAFHCQYLTRFTRIVAAYGLRFEPVEAEMLTPRLRACGIRL